MAHDEHRALGRFRRAKPRDELAPVTRIENPRLDPGYAAKESIEVLRNQDLVAGRILRIEGDELRQERKRVTLRSAAIEAVSVLCRDAGNDEECEEQGP